MLLKEIQELRSKLEVEAAAKNNNARQTYTESTFPHSNSQIKAFNSLPKSLRDFYNQMENGSEELPKFSELIDFKTNKSTKAAYCKRKAIIGFIKAYRGGVDECLHNYEHLSPLQVYDQYIKKTRQTS